jgi:chromosome segregation ATPase
VPLGRKSSEKQDTPPAGGSSLAASAGDQVRAIVEAAEATAAEIRAAAQREAKQVLADARRELRKAQQDAASQAAGEVSKIAQAAASLLERIEAMDQEAGALMETLRAGAGRLTADLRQLEDSLADVKGAVAPPPEPEEDEDDVVVAAVIVDEDGDDLEEEPPADGEEDLEGARLIALNMALNGTARDEIDAYLEENFDLVNRGALLDEVFASVEG